MSKRCCACESRNVSISVYRPAHFLCHFLSPPNSLHLGSPHGAAVLDVLIAWVYEMNVNKCFSCMDVSPECWKVVISLHPGCFVFRDVWSVWPSTRVWCGTSTVSQDQDSMSIIFGIRCGVNLSRFRWFWLPSCLQEGVFPVFPISRRRPGQLVCVAHTADLCLHQ